MTQGISKNVQDLGAKELKFCAEYAIDENGTRSAIAAGYTAKSAACTASRLLKKIKIQQEIARLTNKTLDKLEITRERVLGEIAKLAFYDPGNLLEPDGSMKQIKDIDDVTRMAVAGLEVVELLEGSGDERHAYGLCKKIKLADKGQNLERLGRHLKLFTDKVEAAGENGGPICFTLRKIEGRPQK
jgi:phage terminase small subunit